MDTSIRTSWIYQRKMSFEDGYRIIKNAGFDGIDWSLDESWNTVDVVSGIKSPCIFSQGVDAALKAYDKELSVIEKTGLKLCIAHAPFPSYVSGFPEIEPYSHEILINCIKFCAKLGIPTLVVHGVTQLLNNPNENYEQNREINLRLFRSLIEEVKKTNVTICLENIFGRYIKQITQGFCADPYEANFYVDTLNKDAGKDCFAFCLDTGHLNLVGGNQPNFIKQVGSRLKALHIQDNLGTDDNHLMPYAGSVRWEDVLDALKEVHYSGVVNFETQKQLEDYRMSEALVETFANTMGKTARYFATRISG